MRCLLAALILVVSAFPLYAQQTLQNSAPSSMDDAHSAPVTSPKKNDAGQDQHDAAAKSFAEHGSSQSPDNQRGGWDGGSHGNGKDFAQGTPPNAEGVTAQYTVYLVFATIALVGATITLAVATIGLYRQTKRLAEQAVEAAADTKRSIEISERSAHETARAAQAAVDALNSERAWLTFDGPFFLFGSDSVDDLGVVHKKAFGVHMKWVNSGRAPA